MNIKKALIITYITTYVVNKYKIKVDILLKAFGDYNEMFYSLSCVVFKSDKILSSNKNTLTVGNHYF